MLHCPLSDDPSYRQLFKKAHSRHLQKMGGCPHHSPLRSSTSFYDRWLKRKGAKHIQAQVNVALATGDSNKERRISLKKDQRGMNLLCPWVIAPGVQMSKQNLTPSLVYSAATQLPHCQEAFESLATDNLKMR